MVATLNVCVAFGPENTPYTALIEDVGLRFGLEDNLNPTHGIVRPSESIRFDFVSSSTAANPEANLRARGLLFVAATIYSLPKTLFLRASDTAAHSITNRRVRLSQELPSGLALFAQKADEYYPIGHVNNPVLSENGVGNDVTPKNWVRLSSGAYFIWDDSKQAVAKDEQNGCFLRLVLGVSTSYVGGADPSLYLSDLELDWDEQ